MGVQGPCVSFSCVCLRRALLSCPSSEPFSELIFVLRLQCCPRSVSVTFFAGQFLASLLFSGPSKGCVLYTRSLRRLLTVYPLRGSCLPAPDPAEDWFALPGKGTWLGMSRAGWFPGCSLQVARLLPSSPLSDAFQAHANVELVANCHFGAGAQVPTLWACR